MLTVKQFKCIYGAENFLDGETWVSYLSCSQVKALCCSLIASTNKFYDTPVSYTHLTLPTTPYV